MVTNLHDIESAVAERLQSVGHTVTATEVEEGFDKPTFFIDIFQNSVKKENSFMELVNVGVELKYIHNKPTREVLVNTADALTVLFTQTALKVKDRFLSVYEITFDTENNVLFAYFELEFMRETLKINPDYEKMHNLNFNFEMEVRTNGTAPNID